MRVTEKCLPEPNSSSSFSLLVGLREGNTDSWRRLVDLYGPLVQTWCGVAGVSGDRVADVLQDVFIAVHRSADRFEPKSGANSFRGWLWTITRNKIRDHFRQLALRPEARGGSTALRQLHDLVEPTFPDISPRDITPEDESWDEPSEVSDTTALLHRALAMVRVEFREKTWQAFWHSTVLGQPTDIIADELGVSQAVVRQSKSRVLRRLRQQLGDLE